MLLRKLGTTRGLCHDTEAMLPPCCFLQLLLGGSSDKAEMFHQVALANQDLMVLIGHHHCQQRCMQHAASSGMQTACKALAVVQSVSLKGSAAAQQVLALHGTSP